jgi:GNAT superfamily N-acetyltransferase
MSEIVFRLATTSDVESLTTMRLAFLAEILPDRKPGPELRDAMSQFFTDALSAGEFVAYLAVADSKVIASSGLAFHRHPPSIANPTGREAYIMNMYTLPEFRRRGIATELLSLLVDHARENHCGKVSLHAMANGRSIYVKAGFVAIETEMRLNIAR